MRRTAATGYALPDEVLEAPQEQPVRDAYDAHFKKPDLGVAYFR